MVMNERGWRCGSVDKKSVAERNEQWSNLFAAASGDE